MPSGFHILAAEARRLQEAAGMQRLDTDSSYWPVLQRLVLTGQVETALQLLTAHPAYAALQDPDMAAKVINLMPAVRWVLLVIHCCLLGELESADICCRPCYGSHACSNASCVSFFESSAMELLLKCQCVKIALCFVLRNLTLWTCQQCCAFNSVLFMWAS
jgi:hypothetical protein